MKVAVMRKYKAGDHVLVKLSGGRIKEATIKAIIETTNGVRLQVSFGDETARIYEWQIVKRFAEPQPLLHFHTILALETFDHHTKEQFNFLLIQTVEHHAVDGRLVRLMQIGIMGTNGLTYLLVAQGFRAVVQYNRA